ncbi:MAG: hypothetical protein EOS23_32190 [Mesorhizobium sp.]|nr:MAG: hypothetical protein EOQ56_34370 [Mesorhizobium sp.]RWE06049.1 MAG: hypothetical protein EOS23_32190 [Mesorhizobium sp.]RWO04073.1 MAG: hypothetical protein EOS07_31180 [Mesorhizobium sp.]
MCSRPGGPATAQTGEDSNGTFGEYCSYIDRRAAAKRRRSRILFMSTLTNSLTFSEAISDRLGVERIRTGLVMHLAAGQGRNEDAD